MRPSSEDLAYVWASASEWIDKKGTPRVLLLGVTPELYQLPWPAGTDLLAVDRSQAMIDAMWLGPKEAVLCEDWLRMELPEGSRDIALLDGGLHLLSYPRGQLTLIRLLHHVLSDEGLCIFRLFVLPSRPETPDAVIGDLLEGKIGNPSILKLRWLMSMQKDAEAGFELGAAHDTLVEAVPDLEALAAKLGWRTDTMQGIHNQRGLMSKVHLLTLEQTIDSFCGDSGGFGVRRLQTPSYELGECCPTVALQRFPRR